MTPRAKFVALVLGVGVMIPTTIWASGLPLPLAVAAFASAFALPAFAAAWFAPRAGWEWGYMISLPFLIVMLFSLAFAGYVEKFLVQDLPIVVAAVGGAIGAAALGSKWSRRKGDGAVDS